MLQCLFYGKDTNQEYTVLVQYLKSQGQEQKCKQNLEDIQQKAKLFKQFIHPNIIRYIDEFIIDNYYFILFEKCDKTLQEWIVENKNISFEMYLSIANQMLEGLNFLHSKSYFLKNPSLNSIFLDNQNNVKYLQFEQVIEPTQNIGLHQLQFSELDRIKYIPQEQMVVEDDGEVFKQRINYSIKGDVWSICMCLYELAGAKQLHCKNLALGYESYQIQHQIHYKINLILKKALQVDPSQRPSVQDLINQFSQIPYSNNGNQTIKESENELDIFSQAQLLFDNTNYKQSIELFMQLINMQPNNDKYLAWIGRVYCANSQLEESEYWSTYSLKLNPNNDIAYFNLGNIFKFRKQGEKAIEQYQKSLNCNPKSVFSLNNLGLLYDQQGMHQEAQKIFLEAIESNPDKSYLYYNIGRSYYLDKKSDEALKWFEQTLKIDPKYYKAIAYLGEISIDKNNTDEAIKHFKKSLEVNPGYESSLFSLGTVYYSKNNFTLAKIYFKRAQKQQITNSVMNVTAATFYCQKKFEKSIKYYKLAIKLKKNDQTSLTYLNYSKKQI